MATFAEKIAELEERILINKDKMDDELVQQPDLFYQAGTLHVRAASKADQLKNERDLAYGAACGRARESLIADQGKATDKAVEAAAEQDTKYQAAVAAYMDACKTRDLAEVLKEAFKQRSYMLDPLCTLQATVYASSKSAGSREAAAEAVRKGLAEERKAKTKRD